MSSENQPHFEHNLATANQPGDIGNTEPVEVTNDPAKSLNRGLIILYDKYLSEIHSQCQKGLIDKERADELANHVLSLAENDGVRNEIGYTSPEKAQEIMGPGMFFGPEEVRKAGIEIREEKPLVPFTSEELERAKELGQMLIYRTSTTMKELNDTIGPELEKEGKGKLLFRAESHENEDFFAIDKIQPGWALVSKEFIPGIKGLDYLEQSKALAQYLVDDVYKDKILPKKYKDALNELVADEEKIRMLINSNRESELRQARDMLVNLKINQLFRQTPAEVIYDCIVYLQNTRQRLHEHDYVWTSIQTSGGLLIHVGGADDIGAGVVFGDCSREERFGTAFSHRGADLKL